MGCRGHAILNRMVREGLPYVTKKAGGSAGMSTQPAREEALQQGKHQAEESSC